MDSTISEGKDIFVESFAERVRQRAEAKGWGQTKLSAALGISTSTINNYWPGKRAWPLEHVPALASALDTNVDWLMSGEGFATETEAILAGSVAPAMRHRRQMQSDVVDVQEIDMAYGLGGTYSDGPVEVQTHQFPRAWLETITRTPGPHLTIARGRGDSMMPTLMDGDMVLIDRSQRHVFEQDAIWALTVGDIAMIKRLRVRSDRVQLLSDNDRVPADEATADEINIVGRVIFIGRRV
jgi:phage repressor protein C with HTH and peptisase S24 domain